MKKQVMKKTYIAPQIEIVMPGQKPVMFTTSPGVGGDYDPGLDIDAKKHDLNIEFRDMWEE